MKTNVVAGIDIGGTNTKIGIIDTKGNTLKEDTISTLDYIEIENFVSTISTCIQKMMASLNHEADLKGIGIGAPNGNFYKGTIEHAANLRWKGIVPMANMIKIQFPDLPVVLTNDANAAAYGEMIYGSAKGLKNFIVITLGTGLGSGIVVNGEMLYGHDGFAGELGHITVFKNGRQCGCGKKGCLETYASANGIKRTVFELLANETTDSVLRNISFHQLSAKDIDLAAKNGDVLAIKAFEITGEILGIKLADMVAAFSPEAIFLFGGLTGAGDLLFNPVRKHFEENLMPVFKNKVKILPSGLQDRNIATLGAAALVLKESIKLS